MDLNKWKKAISVGTSAALLASLFTAMVAGPVSASVSATSAGTFAPGTTSPNTVTFTFVERSAALLAGASSLTVTINDVDGGDVVFSGTPSTAGSTGSLGATAVAAGNLLTVSWAASDAANIETIIVSGLKIAADGAPTPATPGPVIATLGGDFAPFFAPSATSTTTASGVIQDSNTLTAGVDAADILLSSVCPFATNSPPPGADVVNSNATFSDAADARGVTTAPAPVAGVQTVTFTAGTASHAAGVTVTQTVSQLDCGAATIPTAVGIIAAALAFASPQGNLSVFPGENNQLAGNLTLTEPALGFLTDGTTVTLKITTAGVLFSQPPSASPTTGNILLTGQTSAATNEVQTLTLGGGLQVGDLFTLTYDGQTTADIAITATGATVQTALEALSNLAPGDVAVGGVAGGPYTVTFGGTLAATNVVQITGAPGSVDTGAALTVTGATTTSGAPLGSAAMVLSADRTTATLTVSTASTGAPSVITVSNIRYDIASTVASGTLVTVEATASGGKLVNPATRTNAQVGRIFTATAPTPNVNIGQNGQVTGLITIVEVTAGAFTDGTGAVNTFQICPDSTASFTSPGPSAFVTGGVAAGNIILREGAAASPDNIVPGTPNPAAPGCYYWTVWTKSTTASTITIGSSATVGALVNVANNVPAGPLNVTLSSGSLAALVTQVTLQVANRVFSSQVQVSAVSQPIIAPGATHALAGDILIQETGNGQLKLGSRICVEIVPNQNTGTLTDVFLTSLTTADLPVATAANGVVIGPVSFSSLTCSGLNGAVGTIADSFSFVISQQSTTGTGKVTISNIHYSAVNDAATGPVQVNVWGFSVGGASIDFQRIISNARVGAPLAGTNATRLGVTQVGAFTTSTKVAKVRKYVTYRIDFGVAAAGRAVQIWGATKTGNDWSAFTVITTRTANASGVVYYYIRQNSATWRSYRGYWVTGGAWSPARQARWIP